MAFKVKTSADNIYEIPYLDGSTVKAKPMDNTETTKLRKRHTTIKPSRSGPVEETNYDTMLAEKFRICVVDWDFLDEQGNAWPCNDSNKNDFYKYNTDDALEILKSIDALKASDLKVQEKN